MSGGNVCVTVQTPEKSGWPSPPRGAGAARFGFPSEVRGISGVGWLSHCASAGHAPGTNETTTAMVRATFMFISKPSSPALVRPGGGVSDGNRAMALGMAHECANARPDSNRNAIQNRGDVTGAVTKTQQDATTISKQLIGNML